MPPMTPPTDIRRKNSVRYFGSGRSSANSPWQTMLTMSMVARWRQMLMVLPGLISDSIMNSNSSVNSGMTMTMTRWMSRSSRTLSIWKLRALTPIPATRSSQSSDSLLMYSGATKNTMRQTIAIDEMVVKMLWCSGDILAKTMMNVSRYSVSGGIQSSGIAAISVVM